MTVISDGAQVPKAEDPAASLDHLPTLGIIPQSTTGRIFLAWAFLNFILAILPAFNVVGNGTQMVAGILPLTVLYSYSVFTVNCCLGLVYFLLRGRAWAKLEDANPTIEESKA